MEKIRFSTEIWTGDAALQGLLDFHDQRVFIVTDPFMVKSGNIAAITDQLSEKNEIKIFSDIVPDPPITKITLGVEALNKFNATVVVAVGGGSAIDAAKAMKFFTKRITKQKEEILFIAIPTTSGTGSEVTNFSVITNSEAGIKYPLVTDEILPQIAILDADLVKTAPQNITVDTGMDVLTHCLEAYVSIDANDFSDALAEKAFQLVFENIEKVSKDGSNIEARQRMHNASCIAGMAFNLANLGLNHGIAHAAGAKFHIPHGRLNTILLPHIIAYNANIARNSSNVAALKYCNLARLIGLSASNPRIGIRSLTNTIIQLRRKLKMPDSFQAYGIKKELFDQSKNDIAEAALKDGTTAANPRKPTKEDIIAILEESFTKN
ncbi:1-propanol dehydrogenase PduQ [Loigolactobacillus jiayinensis]|uniref:1-propanol dehydrogenase PduQ n=1 Tax=Loigolactobacillus jiayinensis TaxID=2486016 RepID=A0ABW1RDK8_9LACO|nr:1-propanol dehydrogenase PduQ [Loigolactobacillus jiayinensis]